jgi:predicted phage tail protein
VTSYEYCYDTTNDNACSGWTGNGTATSVGLSGLATGTTYYWHVRAVNGFGTTYANGSATAFWYFTTGSPPESFNKISPADGAVDQFLDLTLTWGTSSGVTSYEYCFDTTDDETCSGWFSNGTSTSVNLSGLSTGTTYYWQVRAVNGFGTTYANGSATAFWYFTTGSPPSAFDKIAPADGAIDQMSNPMLSWDTSSGAVSYEYCYDTTDDNACSGWIGNGTAASVELTGLATGTTYYWQVRALNDFGTTYANGSDTADWSFTTGNLPGAFSKISPADGTMDQPLTVTLSWGASSGAVSYEYCYDTTDDNDCSSWMSNGSNTSVDLSGLAVNTTYYWQARAVNDFGVTYADGSEPIFWTFTTTDFRWIFLPMVMK